MGEKKFALKDFFVAVADNVLATVLYPTASFAWYIFCKKNKDADAKNFLRYGIRGIGVICFLAAWFIIDPYDKIIFIIAVIYYAIESFKQTIIIIEKSRRISCQKSAITSESKNLESLST